MANAIKSYKTNSMRSANKAVKIRRRTTNDSQVLQALKKGRSGLFRDDAGTDATLGKPAPRPKRKKGETREAHFKQSRPRRQRGSGGRGKTRKNTKESKRRSKKCRSLQGGKRRNR